MSDFRLIQTGTGWGRVLGEFAAWCALQPGRSALDVGCGPGLFPALLESRAGRAFGVDLELENFQPEPLHARVAVADALALPFPERTFHLVTSSNLLFLLEDPRPALLEMARVLRSDGWLACLDPSEHMTVVAAESLAEQRGLTGLARESLVGWAQRAQAGQRWSEPELGALLGERLAFDGERSEGRRRIGPVHPRSPARVIYNKPTDLFIEDFLNGTRV